METLRKPLYRPTTAERRELAVATLARTAIVQLRVLVDDDGSRPEQIARRDFDGDQNVVWLTRGARPLDRNAGWLIKGSVDQATTADMPALLQEMTADFIGSLTGIAAAPVVIARSLQLIFGKNASISVPAFITDASKAGFVKEGDPIPVHSRLVEPCELTLGKLATISTLTVEMATGTNAEPMIKDVMKQDTVLALDPAFFDANPAVAQTRPAGIRHNIAASTASAVPDASNAMVADIKTLVSVVAPVAGNEPIVLVASPARAKTMPLDKQIDLSSFIVLPSSAIADDDLIAIAPRAIVSATGGTPEITTSKEALLHMDTVPADIGSGAGVAAAAVSVYQSGQLALKCRLSVAWQLRDDRAVAWLTTTNW